MREASDIELVSAYAAQQRHLVEFLKDWVDQDSFDAHSSEMGSVYSFAGATPRSVPESIRLGTIYSSGARSEWLHLLQVMINLGVVEAKECGRGKTWYRTKSHENV